MSRSTDECELLKASVSYDRTTGEFIWLRRDDRSKAWNTRFAGKPAGGSDKDGYVSIHFDGKLHKAHRLAWLYIFGRWPNGDIDHINRNPADNRIDNLRECTRPQNNQNRSLLGSGASKYTGVSFCSITGKWRAKIGVGGDQIHLGRFASEEEARDAYLTAKGGLHDFLPISGDQA